MSVGVIMVIGLNVGMGVGAGAGAGASVTVNLIVIVIVIVIVGEIVGVVEGGGNYRGRLVGGGYNFDCVHDFLCGFVCKWG